MQSIDNRVVARIKGYGRGWVFVPGHFLDLGSREAVRQALSRHARAGTIRQLARGLYDYPVEHPTLGRVAPSSEAIAKALVARDAVRLQPTGAYAANVLGLSEQVPTRVVFLTDGPYRRVKLGKREIILKRTTPRNMATAGRKSGTIIQALRHIGPKNVDEHTTGILRRKLSSDDKIQLRKDLKYAPEWIAAILRRLTEEER